MTELLVVITITILAVLSPGADFALVTRNSLLLSRRHGVLTALGIGLGVMLHIGYSLLGVGVLLQQSLLWFNGLKIAGALYLIYLGVKLLRSPVQRPGEGPARGAEMSSWGALRSGFLTNALNPKTMLFVVSAYSQVVQPGASLGLNFAYGAFMSLAHWVWFSLVALFFSREALRQAMLRRQRMVDRVIGVALIGLGVAVVFVNVR